MDLNSRDANIASTFDKGLQAHNSGDLSAAEQLYQKTLAMQPDHCEANHNIGAVFVAKNELDKALEFFKFALDTSPNVSLFWASYIDALIKLDRITESKTLVKALKDAGISCDKIEALTLRLDVEHQDPGPKETSELDALIEQRKFDDAIKACLSLMETYPSSAVLNINLGKCYSELGKIEPAISSYEKATEYQPQWAAGFVMLGQIHSAQGNTDQAIHSLKKALKLQPENYELNSTLGAELLQNGSVDEAIKYLQEALRQDPGSASKLSMIGDAYNQKNEHKLAIKCLKKALKISPDDAMSHFSMGSALHACGSFKAAINSYKSAIKINPSFNEAYAGLGKAQHSSGEIDGAIKNYKKVLSADPNFVEVQNNMGNALNDRGDYEAAIDCYKKAIKLKPDYAAIYNNIGVVQRNTDDLKAATKSYKKAIKLKPDYADPYYNLGNILKDQGTLDEAIEAYKKAVTIMPDFTDAYNNMGVALSDQGEADKAIEVYNTLLAIKPDYADAYNNMGIALKQKGNLKKAVEAYKKGISINPDFYGALNNMGLALGEQGKVLEAIEAFKKALAIKPDYVDAQTNLAIQISDTGDHKTAIAMLSKVLEKTPGLPHATSGLIFMMTQTHLIDANQLSVDIPSYAQALEAPFISECPNFTNSNDPNRCLQIGFVSGDFRTHSVAFFVNALLNQLKTYPNLTLHAYYSDNIEDTVTEDLKKCFSHWTPVMHVSDEKLSSIIIKDNIDILIDLSNHTKHNRLPAFARKLAPLQISAVGLASTTGLTSMDYYFGDNIPVREQDFSECYVGLPSVFAYSPLKEMPPVNTLPALKNGFITFGSFNRTARVNRSCVALWSQLLHQVPNSRFLFAGHSDEVSLNKFIKWFVEEGIELSRITVLPKTGFNEYCLLHHEVDIHLMSFPFSGGTTISNALWMGVPSLGLAQSNDRLEGGYNILKHAGLQNFYAKDKDDFISKGCYFANELTELANIRANLRKEFASSAFCNPEVSAASWATALRIIWKRWCSGMAPEPIRLELGDLEHSPTTSPL